MDNQTQRYYCHSCGARFDVANENFTCPSCSDGFIEEVQFSPPAEPPPYLPPPAYSDVENDPEDLIPGTSVNGNFFNPSGIYMITWRREQPVDQNQNDGNDPWDNIITDFFRSFGVIRTGDDGTTIQVIISNTADFPTRDNFDNLITQLLEQANGNGTPPLPTELIDAIPLVKVTTEDLVIQSSCPVCWEDYQLEEEVKKLPCKHLFHEECIRPWLNLHSNCPMCRRYLGNDPDFTNRRDQEEETPPDDMPTLQQLFQVIRDGSRINSVVSAVPEEEESSQQQSNDNDESSPNRNDN